MCPEAFLRDLGPWDGAAQQVRHCDQVEQQVDPSQQPRVPHPGLVPTTITERPGKCLPLQILSLQHFCSMLSVPLLSV